MCVYDGSVGSESDPAVIVNAALRTVHSQLSFQSSQIQLR